MTMWLHSCTSLLTNLLQNFGKMVRGHALSTEVVGDFSLLDQLSFCACSVLTSTSSLLNIYSVFSMVQYQKYKREAALLLVWSFAHVPFLSSCFSYSLLELITHLLLVNLCQILSIELCLKFLTCCTEVLNINSCFLHEQCSAGVGDTLENIFPEIKLINS